ncbi:hypothetical protein [Paracholeplasma manati]|uniref:hypothetical protein n=1 Tax=Paracholeplasma manati TaxID=591373 RepID=UPI00240886C5|nr:hypothetical protein [Paracholeplasma manati]MDG0889530.1 hypothetical protein [Paracholeplasma manati]
MGIIRMMWVFNAFFSNGYDNLTNANEISDILTNNEWVFLLIGVVLVVVAILALTTEKGLYFLAYFTRRKQYRRNEELTEDDLALAKFAAFMILFVGGILLVFSLFYLLF